MSLYHIAAQVQMQTQGHLHLSIVVVAFFSVLARSNSGHATLFYHSDDKDIFWSPVVFNGCKKYDIRITRGDHITTYEKFRSFILSFAFKTGDQLTSKMRRQWERERER